ncbi:MAG: hypothetical protein HQK91_14340 [Nitrospirae bacterium]|nr:hypothetical protein [Nitrospirota bacterium]
MKKYNKRDSLIAMSIIYSKHIETRIIMRSIDYDLPIEIYNNVKERFKDNETGYTIAVMKAIIHGRF